MEISNKGSSNIFTDASVFPNTLVPFDIQYSDYQSVMNTTCVNSYENVTNYVNMARAPASDGVVGAVACMFFVIGSTGIVGNVMVIIIIACVPKMRKSMTNLFILNVAIADLLIMLMSVPEIVQVVLNRGWVIGLPGCKINRFVLVTSLYVSIMSLVAVCVERYVAIVYPIKYKTSKLCGRKRVSILIVLVWPVASGFGIPTVLYNNTVQLNTTENTYLCCLHLHEPYKSLYYFVESSLFYLTPSVLQVVMYYKIARCLYSSINELHTRFRFRSQNPVPNERTMDIVKARRDVIKMLSTSTIVYIVCYAPAQIVLLLNTVSDTPFVITWPYLIFAYAIAYVNSAVNPILYCIFSSNFRKQFKQILCTSCRKRHVGLMLWSKYSYSRRSSQASSRKGSSFVTHITSLRRH